MPRFMVYVSANARVYAACGVLPMQYDKIKQRYRGTNNKDSKNTSMKKIVLLTGSLTTHQLCSCKSKKRIFARLFLNLIMRIKNRNC